MQRKEIPHIIKMQPCNYIERNLREEGNSHCYSKVGHYKGKKPMHVAIVQHCSCVERNPRDEGD
jgi:hypothetical protein